MRRASVLGSLIGVALAVGVLWSCSVDTRSDKLACKVQADCGTTGRVCEQGYCVVDPGAKLDAAIDSRPGDATMCPSTCSSCSLTNHSCMIAGTGGNITCPAGWNCTINCPTSGACGTVSCTAAESCNVTCGTDGACGTITCGGARCTIGCTAIGAAAACGMVSCTTGACDLTCNGTGACGALMCGTGACTESCLGSGACGITSCGSSCQCDITCSPGLTACGSMTCPTRGQHYCATNGSAGENCSSTAFTNCATTCP